MLNNRNKGWETVAPDYISISYKDGYASLCEGLKCSMAIVIACSCVLGRIGVL